MLSVPEEQESREETAHPSPTDDDLQRLNDPGGFCRGVARFFSYSGTDELQKHLFSEQIAFLGTVSTPGKVLFFLILALPMPGTEKVLNKYIPNWPTRGYSSE